MSYPAIADHGLIGDLQTAALVSTDGTIDWFCCPRFDSPSVFGALLDDEDGGRFALHATSPDTVTKQMYLPDTAILVTRFLGESGVAEVLDFMPIDKPGEVTDRHRLVRVVRGIRGKVELEASIEPRFDYGRQKHETRVSGKTVRFTAGKVTLRVTSTYPLSRQGGDARSRFTVKAGDAGGFLVESGSGPATRTGHGEIIELFEQTRAFWQNWISQSRYRGRWREVVERSAITLKLMTYAPSGALGGGAHRGPARAGRRRAQLGLPLHLDPRRVVLGLRAARASGSSRKPPRSADGWATGSTSGLRATAEPLRDHVPHRRHAPTDRGDARALGGLARLVPGPDRQRRGGPAPAGHLRRGPRRLYLAAAAAWHRPTTAGTPCADARLAVRQLGPARRRDLGDPRRGARTSRTAGLMCWVALDRAIRLADRLGRPAASSDGRKQRDAHLRSRSWTRAGTPSGRRSSSTTAATCWTPRSC